MTARPRLLLASSNPGKLEELGRLCVSLALQVISPADLDEPLPEIEEDGVTFRDNARKKALAAAAAAPADILTLADDSGLEVDALDGRPGVYSARYADLQAGASASCGESRAARNIALLLAELAGVPPAERTARCLCSLAAGCGGRVIFETEGEVSGTILESPRGDGGFGYDPVFFHPPSGLSFAELPRWKKAAVSHRGAAMRRLRTFLEARLHRSRGPT